MKVAYIIHASDPLAGASKALLSLLAELKNKGVEPYIVLPKGGTIPKVWEDIATRVIPLDFRPCTYPPVRNFKDAILFLPRILGRWVLANKASRELAKIIGSEHIDLIHSNTSIVSIGRDAARIAGVPHIYHFREYGDLDFSLHYLPNWKIFHHRALRSTALCITQGVQKHHFPNGNTNSIVIYDGVMSKTAQPQWTTPHSYFMTAGRVEAAKGLDFILQAYVIYQQHCTNPLPLKVIGRRNDAQFEQHIRHFITQEKLESLIEFMGEQLGIESWARNATATIIASPFEGFGFVMTEAMFYGCLVIGRNTAGTKEQFDNGLALCGKEIGLRYETPEQLAECLQRVHDSQPEDWTATKQYAFKTVDALYTTENNATKVMELYQQLTSSQTSK